MELEKVELDSKAEHPLISAQQTSDMYISFRRRIWQTQSERFGVDDVQRISESTTPYLCKYSLNSFFSC
jgi:hypothetical protein